MRSRETRKFLKDKIKRNKQLIVRVIQCKNELTGMTSTRRARKGSISTGLSSALFSSGSFANRSNQHTVHFGESRKPSKTKIPKSRYGSEATGTAESDWSSNLPANRKPFQGRSRSKSIQYDSRNNFYTSNYQDQSKGRLSTASPYGANSRFCKSSTSPENAFVDDDINYRNNTCFSAIIEEDAFLRMRDTAVE